MRTDRSLTVENPMRTEPILGLLLKMAAPAVLSMLIQSLYNIVDSLFVSRISEEALRAVTIVFPVQQMVGAVSIGTAIGVSSYVARRLGARDNEVAGAAATHGMVLSVLSWAILAVISYGAAPAVIRFFTHDASVITDGIAYMRIVNVLSIGFFLMIASTKTLQATGNMLRPMLISLISTAANVILDPILIFGKLGFPAMGVAGAAYATVIAQILGAVLGVYALFRHNDEFKVKFRGFRFDGDIIREIYRVGAPTLVSLVVTASITMIFNAIIRPYSEIAITVLGLYFRLESFVLMPLFGLGQGMVPLAGYNYGAGLCKRVLETLRYSMILMLVHLGFCTVLFEVFPVQLLSIFNATPDMIDIGIPLLRIIGAAFLFIGINITSSNFFQALGRGLFSFLVSMLRQLVLLVPLAYLFAQYDLNLVWYSYLISDGIASVVSVILLIYLIRKELKPAETCRMT